MLESESSALPFGDGPLSRDREYLNTTHYTLQALFSLFLGFSKIFQKIYWYIIHLEIFKRGRMKYHMST